MYGDQNPLSEFHRKSSNLTKHKPLIWNPKCTNCSLHKDFDNGIGIGIVQKIGFLLLIESFPWPLHCAISHGIAHIAHWIEHCPLPTGQCHLSPSSWWTVDWMPAANASVQQLMLHRHCTERGVLSSKCNFHCINSAVNASLSFLQFKLFARRLLIRKAL